MLFGITMPKSAKSDLNFLDRKNRGEMSMEKNRIRPIKSGKSFRMSYSRQKEVLEMPNLIEIQVDSYKWFLESGLKEVFDDISPITDYSGKLSLEFVDFTLCEDDVKYSIEECKERDATYAAPLKVKVRLHNKENDEINEHEIFMGDLPLMTATGTFVINGAERVIVSQQQQDSTGIRWEHSQLYIFRYWGKNIGKIRHLKEGGSDGGTQQRIFGEIKRTACICKRT